MKAVKAKFKIWKRKQTKTHLIQFQMSIFYQPACLQKNFHRRVLSIRVFSSDGHCRLISVSRQMNIIASRDLLNQ